MGIAQIPAPSTSTTKTLGLSVLSTNASITSLPTNKEITAVVIGGGGGSGNPTGVGSTGGGGIAGGGSGQIREYTFTLGSSITASVTIGSGGTGGANASNSGNNGGSTTLTLPGIATIVAPGGGGSGGGSGSVGGPGGGSGGGAGGSGTPTPQGVVGAAGGIFGSTGSLSSGQYGSTVISPAQNATATSDTYEVLFDSIVSGSTTLSMVGSRFLNVLPGANIVIRGDSQINGVSFTPSNGSLTLTSAYSGSTTSGYNAIINGVVNNPYSTIKDAVSLLTAANITLPGGGGGGGGSRTDASSPARVGGSGAGTGGAGGTGAVTGQPSPLVSSATHGTAGVQPGGGAGGSGGVGYSSTGGPAGTAASGGNGAVYFFWVA